MSDNEKVETGDFLEPEAAYLPAEPPFDPTLEPPLQQYSPGWSRQGAPLDFLEGAPGEEAGELESPGAARNPLGLPARVRGRRRRPMILTGSRRKGG